MTPADKKQFAAILTGFAELKGKQLSSAALDLFWNAMQGWTIQDFTAAANHLIRTCEFMPTPKDFEDLRRAAKPTASEAWLTARKSLEWGLHGYTVKRDCDPLVRKAIWAIGGPDAIALCATDKLPFVERRFCEVYDSLDETTETREALPNINRERLSHAATALIGRA